MVSEAAAQWLVLLLVENTFGHLFNVLSARLAVCGEGFQWYEYARCIFHCHAYRPPDVAEL